METGNLRNEDFRKLLTAPKKVVAEGAASGGTSHSFTHRHQAKPEKKKGGGGHKHKKEKIESNEDEANLKEILKNYRDRALERRLKGNDDNDEIVKLAAAYRAMPGDARAVTDKANLRRQAIEESKYLGGDMEHTHLVKGLDYSLLNKVRSEINKSQTEVDTVDELELAFDQKGVDAVEKMSDNKMVRGIHRILFKNELPLRNELFGKGRMAYVVDMEDEEADIPTTLLRSVHDCPKAESNANINANNMLISKLTQVLSYLRADHKKKKKPELTEEEVKKYQSQSIYDNETEYAPKRDKDKDRRDKDRDQKRDRNYFDTKDDRNKRDDRDKRDKERDRRGGREHDRRDRDRDKDKDRDRDRERERERERERKEREERDKEKRLEEKMEKRRKEAEGGGYDECYPGGMAEMAGGWDSDEEDLTMMDMGAKKSTIKRWEFDNDDDYEKFQGSREAMPKAAYQYGVKTGDGRKTRKSVDVNKKIDKELNQITKLIEKRKSGVDEDRDYKRPKF
ncbi:IK cytokine down-regulator of HLA class II [Trichostrongylus colubriformis]|uniref:IK cytokine down-regulator of HLA class II n=1 Tax=Trichostrongylus colubriformis TaxID=6319 RepID=A0AAN8FCT3_TRICO